MIRRRTEPVRQLPLDLGHTVGLSRDDLVVTPSNRDAVALIDGWPDWPAPVAVIVGPAGTGKSHLAAIWREQAGAVSVDMTPAGKLHDVVTASPLLIEDIDAEPIDETMLFHLINVVRSAGSHMLLTARRRPVTWNVKLPDLASRLRAATVVEVAEPDDALLAGVLSKLFADRQVQVEPHVIRYLVQRMERSLAAASVIVETLDRLALERRLPITRQLAAEILPVLEGEDAELD